MPVAQEEKGVPTSEQARCLYDGGYRASITFDGESSTHYMLTGPDGLSVEIKDRWDPPGSYDCSLSIISGNGTVPFDLANYENVSILEQLTKLNKAA